MKHQPHRQEQTVDEIQVDGFRDRLHPPDIDMARSNLRHLLKQPEKDQPADQPGQRRRFVDHAGPCSVGTHGCVGRRFDVIRLTGEFLTAFHAASRRMGQQSEEHRNRHEQASRQQQIPPTQQRPVNRDRRDQGGDLGVAATGLDRHPLRRNLQRRGTRQSAVPDHHPRIRRGDDQRVLTGLAATFELTTQFRRQDAGQYQSETPVDPAPDARDSRNEHHSPAVGLRYRSDARQNAPRERCLRQSKPGQQHQTHLKGKGQKALIPDRIQPHPTQQNGPRTERFVADGLVLRKYQRNSKHPQRQQASQRHRIGQKPLRKIRKEITQSTHASMLLQFAADASANIWRQNLAIFRLRKWAMGTAQRPRLAARFM